MVVHVPTLDQPTPVHVPLGSPDPIVKRHHAQVNLVTMVETVRLLVHHSYVPVQLDSQVQHVIMTHVQVLHASMVAHAPSVAVVMSAHVLLDTLVRTAKLVHVIY